MNSQSKKITACLLIFKTFITMAMSQEEIDRLQHMQTRPSYPERLRTEVAKSRKDETCSQEPEIIECAAHLNFHEWKRKIDRLPKLKMPGQILRRSYPTPLTWQQFKHQSQTFVKLMEKELTDNTQWLAQCAPHEDLFRPNLTPSLSERTDKQDLLYPYAQKIVISPKHITIFHGDLHGDIHTLNNLLNILSIQDPPKNDPLDPFKIIDPNLLIIFLGDYSDRGPYGPEVIYTIMRLKCTNPSQVFMVRGNHEDIRLNRSITCGSLLSELFDRFGEKNHSEAIATVSQIYELLPLVIYLGSKSPETTNYIQCCHGGLDTRFNPQPLLQSKESQYALLDLLLDPGVLDELTKRFETRLEAPHYKAFKEVHKDTTITTSNGFMWSDFDASITSSNPAKDAMYHNQIKPLVIENTGRGSNLFIFGKRITEEYLNIISSLDHVVRGVFRAHQHSDEQMMRRILNMPTSEWGHYYPEGVLLYHQKNIGVGKLWVDEHTPHQEPDALWHNIVCTFLVAPNTGYASYPHDFYWDFDAFGALITAKNFKDWKLIMNIITDTNYAEKADESEPSGDSSDMFYC
jgi:hypothetical protein